ncbi:RICIN domain-containing protein [Chromobacterium piscinae]|uniref:RICIN domain-containing protein n=1 Tax=Chromobacterium piscinae TaxID=686831 RepID=UPI001E42152C|nr:ricin-type beta-trefoil lectin domain protein [Chromobacterium piscinae]MCD4504801.1 ricin-type beta-trefoil lectin domain protein [Chromobacterium piscinae]MCD5327114.1 ricin-type beta-trefoil lectin domain protein [Chromobacterium piscinae]
MRAKNTLSLLLLLSLSPLAHALGKTPGTYTNYRFPATASAGMDAVDFTIKVDRDPGYSANVYWANQFDLVGTSGAYTGMQSNGGGKRTFLFSAWDTTDAKAGSVGSYCTTFSGEGTGRSCRIHVDWTQGHSYRFHVAYEAGGWLGVTVTDQTSGASFKLGSIKTAASKISPHNMVNWAEYFEWNSNRATCLGQPYSKATFGVPSGFVAGRLVPASISGTSVSDACPVFSKVTAYSQSSAQENGIGNSTRGPIANGSQCLDASGGASEGAAAITYGCHGGGNQAWVHAKDGSLQLKDNYCLEEHGSGVDIRSCSGTSAWTRSGSAIRSAKSGLCLSANRSGQPVSLLQCGGTANQSWSLPTR